MGSNLNATHDAPGKALHGWHATAYSDGKKRVYVTFEEVKTVGASA